MGLVFYRCSYAPEVDEKWNDLKRSVERLSESIANESDTPAIAKTMDFVFIEDPALEGASIEDLRPRFQAWARKNAPSDVEDPQKIRGSRYEYFIRVGDEGLSDKLLPYVELALGWSLPQDSEDPWAEEIEDDDDEQWDRMKIHPLAVVEALDAYVSLESTESFYIDSRSNEVCVHYY